MNKRKPRIALLPPRVWNSTWGQEKNLVGHLAERFRIDVLDLMDFGGRHRKAGPNRFPPPEGVRVVERPLPPGLILQGLYLELANGLRLLFGRYDLLVTYLTLGGVLAVLAARLRGVRVLLIYADDYVAFYRAKSALAGRITARIANPLAASLAHRAAATAELLAQDIRPHNPGVEVIPNGADADKLARVPEKKGGQFTVGFVGGFGHWVDFGTVLAAARELEEVCFVLVGGGDMYDQVAREAQGLANVRLTGQVDYDRVLEELAGMDACLIPFKKDGLTDRVSPIKLFEYWAASRPVIATPHPGGGPGRRAGWRGRGGGAVPRPRRPGRAGPGHPKAAGGAGAWAEAGGIRPGRAEDPRLVGDHQEVLEDIGGSGVRIGELNRRIRQSPLSPRPSPPKGEREK